MVGVASHLQGQTLLQANRLHEAKEMLAKAVVVHAGCGCVHQEAGTVYLQLGLHDQESHMLSTCTCHVHACTCRP